MKQRPHPSSSSGPGARIREARLEAGLTQEQLAGNELTKALVSHIELGRTRPSARSLQIISQRLGRDASYLLGKAAANKAQLLELHERAAEAASAQQDWVAVLQHTRAALRTADRRASVKILRLTAEAEAALGHREKAYGLARRALSQVRDGPREIGEIVRLYLIRANGYFDGRRLAAGAEELERAFELAQKHGLSDPALLARLDVNLGTAYRRLGLAGQARSAYARGLGNARRVDALRLAGRAYQGLAAAHYDAGELQASIDQYQRARDLFERAADAEWELNALRSMAEVHLELGQVKEARSLAERTLSRGADLGETHQPAIAKIVLGRIALKEGRTELALRFAQEAERVLSKAGDTIQQADAVRLAADIHHDEGKWSSSDRLYKKALRLLERSSRPAWARAASAYADRLYQRGHLKKAYELLASTRTPTAEPRLHARPRASRRQPRDRRGP
ncbi:MAG: tetratricopeptide repeat protein [Chloroflexi bacterium]|nr:tetratricopeptide repeat protein [Chloroflexota bacterium]